MASHDALAGVLRRMPDRWPTSAVARELTGAGVPVFPCVPGGKRPLTEHGFHDATNNPDQAEAWWRQHPNANIGVPTGAASGVVVVDVDVHDTVNGFAAFERAHRAEIVDGWQVLVSTPSGGMHAYYPATPGEVQRSWQAARAGIDFRGDGGYIIIPPSMVVTNGTGAKYRVRQINTDTAATVDSDGLRTVFDPRPASRRPANPSVRHEPDVSRLAAWVANRGEGERNRGLFWAACRLAETGVPTSEVLDALSVAAGKTGLSEPEITATVRSAYRTVQPRPQTSSRLQDGSSATDGWFSRDAIERPSPPMRGLS